MKSMVDTFKQNEVTFKQCLEDNERKLTASEERYQSLRRQAESKMEQWVFYFIAYLLDPSL